MYVKCNKAALTKTEGAQNVTEVSDIVSNAATITLKEATTVESMMNELTKSCSKSSVVVYQTIVGGTKAEATDTVTNSTKVVVTAEDGTKTTYSVVIAPTNYTLTVTNGTGGSVTLSSTEASYAEGAKVEITITNAGGNSAAAVPIEITFGNSDFETQKVTIAANPANVTSSGKSTYVLEFDMPSENLYITIGNQ